jgi:hypothetical protein
MITAALRHDTFDRPGPVGYLLDTTRSTLAWSSVWATAVVAPVTLGSAGTALSGLVVAAGIAVAVPGYLPWCGLTTPMVERARAAGWLVLAVALLAVIAQAPAPATSAVGSFGLIIGLGLAFYRTVRWLDAHAEAIRDFVWAPVQRRPRRRPVEVD